MRDLAWSCFSPPLLHIEQLTGNAPGISSCPLQLTPARVQWLRELDREPSALLRHLSARPTRRLGVYFEQLWHFFLQQDPQTELLAHNLPVQGEHCTLGEFDCIYYCAQRDCHVHLELAVKYYLGVSHGDTAVAGPDTRDWLGPDTRDRLDIKLAQLLQRQIRLGDLPEARPRLHALGVTKLQKEIAFKGYLFWPHDAAMRAPPAYNPACARNHWLRCKDLLDYCATLGTRTVLALPRMRWLSTSQSHQLLEVLDCDVLASQLAEQFATDDQYPQLVALLDQDGHELKRFFITPDCWPAQRS